jgi:hypothetical protein
MSSADATDVPPNFITTISLVAAGTGEPGYVHPTLAPARSRAWPRPAV